MLWFRQLGHQVTSGPWPFYRLVALAMFVGAIQQLRFGAPDSLKAAVPHWFDWIWLSLMLLASALIIVAIGIMGDTAKSAHIEIGGLIPLFASMLIYIVGYWVSMGQPKSWLTTLPYAIAAFAVLRFFELRRRLQETMAELEAEHAEED